ncbi:DUF4244 domain-containing protein [Actinokineospora auranticolor]|uniref:Uncharacterized protein DUF4244 n=1 Tax=Actinokineospora auranticolor TaxID=155976 RepID=A0A2S6GKM4_9PSEU|nr:DUF4244 domain-containing protein [Actinokineospora auranticolor]PPK65787.1 uncharacterized protein DUF4244 [Actinokineospora auranticolor]
MFSRVRFGADDGAATVEHVLCIVAFAALASVLVALFTGPVMEGAVLDLIMKALR